MKTSKPAAILQENRAMLKDYHVRALYLFGSVVRGEDRPGSDVDILVEFEPGLKTYDNFINLAFFLEDILKRRVDLVTPDALSPYMAPGILKEVEYVTANV